MRSAAPVLLCLAILLAPGAPAARAQTKPFETGQCFAFWRLLEKLRHDGVPALLEKDPKSPVNKPSDAEMERINLYIELEERLAFRCPYFAPPPMRHPDRPPPPPVASPVKSAPAAKPAPPVPPRNPRATQ